MSNPPEAGALPLDGFEVRGCHRATFLSLIDTASGLDCVRLLVSPLRCGRRDPVVSNTLSYTVPIQALQHEESESATDADLIPKLGHRHMVVYFQVCAGLVAPSGDPLRK